MNDPVASGRDILQGFSFKSRGQRDAGPEWQQLSLPANIIQANEFCQLPLRLVAKGNKTHWWESVQT